MLIVKYVSRVFRLGDGRIEGNTNLNPSGCGDEDWKCTWWKDERDGMKKNSLVITVNETKDQLEVIKTELDEARN